MLNSSNILLIKNLNHSVTANHLRLLFSPYGEVLRIQVVANSRGGASSSSKSYLGIVVFRQAASAAKARSDLHKTIYLDRRIEVVCVSPYVLLPYCSVA
uniref:RRM domain-containing protein n=1 Tax=Macrostomum lignano TaxID=282301 RepID=A0A1I8J445_9PLAT